MAYVINLVEDEESLNNILSHYLREEGWQVNAFKTGAEAKDGMDVRPDIWVLDIMLPDTDGNQLLIEVKRRQGDVPVIFMSARNSDMDKINGLELGAEDYIAKPFLPRELIVRVKRILGRIHPTNTEKECQLIPLEIVDGYAINRSKRLVKKDDESIELTSKEFDFILYLVDRQGIALSRGQIIEEVWGQDAFCTDRVVDNLVKRVRKKMPDFRIETIYGYGYRRI